MSAEKMILYLFTIYILASLSYGRKCYAPVICTNGGSSSETTWTEVTPMTCEGGNEIETTPSNRGEKGEKGDMGEKGDKGEKGEIDNTTVTALWEEIEPLKIGSDAINETVQNQQRILENLNVSVESLKEENKKLKSERENLTSESARLQSEITKNNETYENEFNAFKAKLIKLQEAVESNAKSIKDIQKEQNGIPDCKNATQGNAIIWNGTGGVFYIKRNETFYEVYCDTTTDGGGWTVFQRRMDGSTDFYRTWNEYAIGFGSRSREFWLGLENIYQLTKDGAYELRVDLTDWDESTAYAQYGIFAISGRSDDYKLTVQNYIGDAGDSMAAYINGRPFTAKDRDLDTLPKVNCAEEREAAWWYKGCSPSSLNGIYNDTSSKERGVYWRHWRNDFTYSLKGSEMKFRKK